MPTDHQAMTFVINLDSRPDRLERMQKHLTDLGMRFERVEAVS
ncbi:MAG: glycosyltransferase family 25 protein, partial [Pseudomonadota bacterium]